MRQPRKLTSIGLLQEASLVNPTMSLKNMVTSSNSSASTESWILSCSATILTKQESDSEWEGLCETRHRGKEKLFIDLKITFMKFTSPKGILGVFSCWEELLCTHCNCETFHVCLPRTVTKRKLWDLKIVANRQVKLTVEANDSAVYQFVLSPR